MSAGWRDQNLSFRSWRLGATNLNGWNNRVFRAKKTVKSSREMSFGDVAELAIFRMAQKELGAK